MNFHILPLTVRGFALFTKLSSDEVSFNLSTGRCFLFSKILQ